MYTYLKKNERKGRIRRQFLIIMAAFIVAISLFMIGGNHMRSHQVQASSVYSQEVFYKSVRVNAGDTLWTIADEYMRAAYDDKDDYIDEIKEINHITEKDLQAGSYIIVPYTTVVK